MSYAESRSPAVAWNSQLTPSSALQWFTSSTSRSWFLANDSCLPPFPYGQDSLGEEPNIKKRSTVVLKHLPICSRAVLRRDCSYFVAPISHFLCRFQRTRYSCRPGHTYECIQLVSPGISSCWNLSCN